MKKLRVLACLVVLLAPVGQLYADGSQDSQGQDDQGQDGRRRTHTAPEMSTIALGTAAAIGIVGYLALRRRRAHQD